MTNLNEVFVPGGEPQQTYVDRSNSEALSGLARCIDSPNEIVSLAGPSKMGKTVLCKKTLGKREIVWLEGGQINSVEQLWERVGNELSCPDEIIVSQGTQAGFNAGVQMKITASGSRLKTSSIAEKRNSNTISANVEFLIKNKIVLVIDDFHYIDPIVRRDIMRSIKGPVFRGLKLILLSVTHRVFDAIKAEPELGGRLGSIKLAPWSPHELEKLVNLVLRPLGSMTRTI